LGATLATVFEELKRRKVFRVFVAYVVASWLLLQVAEVLSSILTLPEWAPKLVFFLLIIGFVPALILAWAYEVTPEGIRRDKHPEDSNGSSTPRYSSVALIALSVVAAGSLGAILLWMSGADDRWARDVALPLVEQHIVDGDWEQAFAAALKLQERAPDSTLLDEYWSEFSLKTSIPSQPEGATVYRRAYGEPGADWQLLGKTPIHDVRIPRGFSLMRIEMPGFKEVLRIVGTLPIAGGSYSLKTEEDVTGIRYVIPPVNVVLNPADSVEVDDVRVPGTQVMIDGQLVSIADFRIGRYEVTNSEYQAFVDAGGYRDPGYWEHAIIRDRQELTWDEAMAAFVDSTGRPGPSTWIGGVYPEGKADYPVGGISWYEAAAFARFAGRELPTVHHWRRAHAPATVTWQIPASNLESAGVAPVGKHHGTGWTGTSDMLGNVREWCANAVDDQRAILGGSWKDAAYSASALISSPHTMPPFNRAPENGIRLALMTDNREARNSLQRAIKPREPVQLIEPVSDEVFTALLRNYEYSQAPLNATIDETIQMEEGSRQRISFDSGNGQRTELLLYLPGKDVGRHRTILYWPSSLAFLLPALDDFKPQIQFMLRNGWAVALPIFEATFHRGKVEAPSSRTIEGRDLLFRQVREMRRSIDYLETRADIDADSLAYYGYSWGGSAGAIALSVEPRLKVGILNQAGMPRARQVDIHPAHYLPRVRQPVLQFNGRFDQTFSYDDSARPFFEQLGSEHKKHVVEPTGHFVSNSVVIGETLAWLDEHLGSFD
jgi:predicted esterase